jgi:transcriptional regulator GlxA family with amidase domain
LLRVFLDERGATAYVALRQLRLEEAQRRLQAQPDLTPKAAAQQCGFGDYTRFRRDSEACFGASRQTPVSMPSNQVALTMHASCLA